MSARKKKGPQSANFQLLYGDAVEVLRGLGDGTVDLLITDPPYESLEKHRARGTTTRLKHSKSSSNDWFEIFPNRRFSELFAEVYRVLARNAHFYLFCDAETMFVAKPLAERVGSNSGSHLSGTSSGWAWGTTSERATSSSCSSKRGSGS